MTQHQAWMDWARGKGPRPKPPPSVPEESYVYFIRSASPVGELKIGTARNPRARRGQLQTGNPHRLDVLAVIPGGTQEETDLHKQFAHLHIRGEWYLPGDDLMAYIELHGGPFLRPTPEHVHTFSLEALPIHRCVTCGERVRELEEATS